MPHLLIMILWVMVLMAKVTIYTSCQWEAAMLAKGPKPMTAGNRPAYLADSVLNG